MEDQLIKIAMRAHQCAPHRARDLFSKFLPTGYTATTLSCVDPNIMSANLRVKVAIGTLITLYDDLADHPKLRNAALLERMYDLPFRKSVDAEESGSEIYRLAKDLWKIVFAEIATFPNYSLLETAFEFDVNQVFNANRYAEMLTDAPYLFSPSESRNYLHHNMGIVLVGTIDLMSSQMLEINSLGQAREIFLEAQRAARIMNMLTTVDREKEEGDVTNELVRSDAHDRGLIKQQLAQSLAALAMKNSPLFNVRAYVEGLKNLYQLHCNMEGII